MLYRIRFVRIIKTRLSDFKRHSQWILWCSRCDFFFLHIKKITTVSRNTNIHAIAIAAFSPAFMERGCEAVVSAATMVGPDATDATVWVTVPETV